MTLKKPLKTEVKSEPESKELTSQCIIVNDDDDYDVDGFFSSTFFAITSSTPVISTQKNLSTAPFNSPQISIFATPPMMSTQEDGPAVYDLPEDRYKAIDLDFDSSPEINTPSVSFRGQ